MVELFLGEEEEEEEMEAEGEIGVERPLPASVDLLEAIFSRLLCLSATRR
jgi:hypothetical protein